MYSGKCREQAAGAGSDFGSVLLGPVSSSRRVGDQGNGGGGGVDGSLSSGGLNGSLSMAVLLREIRHAHSPQLDGCLELSQGGRGLSGVAIEQIPRIVP